jgi:predicted pyridoxine 5'-phosphate oxidase superfamily flavin-nucleotide-binding protein
MKADLLRQTVHLAQEAGFVMLATADEEGLPHITVAGRLELTDDNSADIAVTEWFCPGTVANLQKNKRVSVVVWTKKIETGYQLLGELMGVGDIGILDGYSPKVEAEHPMPQIEKQLRIKVEKILEFRLGPHSDVEDYSALQTNKS